MIAVQLSLCSYATAQELFPRRFDEYLSPIVPVIGNMLKGILSSPLAVSADPDHLLVWLPSSGQSTLCVTIASVDGTYTATAEYALVNRSEGWYRLHLSTNHASALRALPARELAVLTHVASNCRSENEIGVIVPIQWTTTPRTTDTVIVLANSKKTDIRVYSVDVGDYFPCDRVPTDKHRMAYDVECRISVAPRDDEIELVLVRERFGVRVEEQTIHVYVR